jgi:putative membrane protein insertion efficiency factor
MSVAARVCVSAIRLYQLILSPWLGPACRFAPTCSEYAIEAIRSHGMRRGSWLAVRRLGSCHPLGGSGYDPVPSGRDAVPSGRDPVPAIHLERMDLEEGERLGS